MAELRPIKTPNRKVSAAEFGADHSDQPAISFKLTLPDGVAA